MQIWNVSFPSLQKVLLKSLFEMSFDLTHQRGPTNPYLLPFFFLAVLCILCMATASDSIKDLMKAITQKTHLGNYTQKFAYDFSRITDPLCNSYPLVHSKLPLNLVAQNNMDLLSHTVLWFRNSGVV